MAEVHQKYDFIDSPDPFWDGRPYKGEPTDEPCFVEYANQLKTTEGFHVDLDPESSFSTSIVPENVDSEYTIEAAKAAVKEFNRLKGADLKLSKILNANCLIISSALYFLTLQCSDDFFYEAKIDMFMDESCKLVMFRPAKYWPSREDKNTNEEGGAEPEGSQIIGKKTMSKPTVITMSKPSFTVSKLLTDYDITQKLALPTEILQHIPIPQKTHLVDLQVMDSRKQVWTFQLYTRPQRNRSNPVCTRGWLEFVRAKRLKADDKLTIYGCQDRELHIQSLSQLVVASKLLATVPLLPPPRDPVTAVLVQLFAAKATLKLWTTVTPSLPAPSLLVHKRLNSHDLSYFLRKLG